jgi:hypothetical protein
MQRALAVLALATLAGCGSMELSMPSISLPGFSGPTEITRTPANATEYRCADGKRFYVRQLDGGAVWLIAPDRELRLARAPGAEGRYSAGRVTLEISADGASLTDPPASFEGCRIPSAAPEKPAAEKPADAK